MAGSSEPSLSVLSGPFAGTRFPLSDPTGEVMIGSDPSCAIHLPVPQVSSVHARLSFDESGAFIQDLSEGRGVFVNDDRVNGRAAVRNGDILWLGSPGEADAVMLQCRLPPPAPASDVAASPPLAEAPPPPLADMETEAIFEEAGVSPLPPAEPAATETAPTEAGAAEPESFWFEEPPPAEPPPIAAAPEEAFVVDEPQMAPPSFEARTESKPEAAAEGAPSTEVIEEESFAAPLAPEPEEPEAFFAPPPEPAPTFEEEGVAPIVVPEAPPAPERPAPAPPSVAAEVPAPAEEEADEAATAMPPPLPVKAPAPSPPRAAPPVAPAAATAPAAAPPVPAATAGAARAARAARAERPPAERPPAEKPPVARKPPPTAAARPAPRPRPAGAVARPPARAGGPPVAAIAVGALLVLGVGGYFGMRALRSKPAPTPAPPVVAEVPPSIPAEQPPVAATEAPREAAPIATPAPPVREETVPVVPMIPPPAPVATPLRPVASIPPPLRGAAPVPARPVPSAPAVRTPPPAPATPAPAMLAAPFIARADAAANARNYDEAIGLYDEALKLDPQNAKAAAGKKGALASKEAARHTFVAGRTTVQTGKEKGGLAGFDTSGVSVKGQAADFAGRLDLAMEPAQLRPGDAYALKIYVVNEGKKDIRPSSITFTTTVNGKPSPGTLTPQAKDVNPQQRALVQEVKGVWPEGVTAWSTEVIVNAGKGESLRNRLTWK
jgi:hypothetical protein